MRFLVAAPLALAALFANDARALVWPDVPARVERDISAPDPSTRRQAAHDAAQLGAARGGPLVLRALGDPDEDVRLAAADSAIRLRLTAATDLVIPWLNVKEARVKKKACEVARAMPNARAVAPVARVLGDPDPEARQAAADALGTSGSPEAVAPLLGKLDDTSPPVRIRIVAALARLGDARAVVPLVGKVQDSSVDVRQAVSRALGELGDLRASQALLLQLRDNNNDVRKEAIVALGRLRAPDAVDAIAPFAMERSAPLRFAALAALGRIATKDAVRVLTGALGSFEDASAGLEKTAVREALVAAGAPAIPQLHAVLESPASAQAATSAAWVLGELHAQSESATIIAALRRGALPVPAALHALAGAGGPEAVAVALEFVGDASPVVRAEALRTAEKLLDPSHPDGRAVEPLAAALRDSRPSAAERAKIAILLGRTGAPRAAPVLRELVGAKDPALRLAAIDALGLLGPAGVDDALLDKLSSSDAQVRLHAAVALSESGAARARDVLLEKLDGGDEVDRAAVLTALAGILERVPTDAAVQKLARALDLSAGPERDAILIALARAKTPAALAVLVPLAAKGDIEDRRTIATAIGARSDAATMARALLADGDASVRAQGAWTLGALGAVADIPQLEAIARAAAIDAAVDAAAAIGRIAARAKSPDAASRALCPLAADTRSYVRANALAGLALSGARCGDGAQERKALLDDPSDTVRAAAALTIARAPSKDEKSDDKKALERCAAEDHSGAVAHRCVAPPGAPTHTHAALVYVIADGTSQPHPGSTFAIELADGTIHAGTTDRRGAVFDPVAPEGELSLKRPSALAR